MASAWTPLANLTLGSAANSVTFSSIVGTYRDLYVVVSGNLSGSNNTLLLRFNGDSSNAYRSVMMEANGSSATSYASGSDQSAILVGLYTSTWGDARSVATFQIMDYSATDKHKLALVRSNNASLGLNAVAGRWANTSAVTSVLIESGGTSFQFAAGSTFALYGVSA